MAHVNSITGVDADELGRILTQLDPVQFEEFVRRTLAGSSRFTKFEHLSGDADFTAYDGQHNRQTTFRLKSGAVVLPEAIARFDYEVPRVKGTKRVMVVPGLGSKAANAAAAQLDIAVWGKRSLASITTRELVDEFRTKPAMACLNDPNASLIKLADELTAMPVGLDDWVGYQKLVEKIFSTLFVPPLGESRYESFDGDRRNRRDVIYPNCSVEGFWARLRMHYRADYIVVDAKNKQDGPTKPDVLQVAHYLKAHGAGLFGMIVSRGGCGAAAAHAIREQWIDAGKMVVVLSDDHIRQMLDIAAKRADPTVVIDERIHEARLSY